ncbi:MAG: multiheme c-type cytochrome [Pseudomonadota bacterium]
MFDCIRDIERTSGDVGCGKQREPQRPRFAFIAHALLLCGLFGLLSTPLHAAQLTLVYTGNLDGELEPCGCSAGGDLGGIKRQVHMLDRLRAKTPDLIALSTGGLIISEMPQDRLKSAFILSGASALGFDAIGVQGRDLGFGAAFLKDVELPWVASNLHGVAHVATERIITRGALRLAFLQWLAPDTAAASAETTLDADSKPLAQRLHTLKQQGVLTAVGTTLTLEQTRAILPLNDIDILLIKSKYEVYGEPQKVANTLVLQPGSRGMRLAQILLTLDEHGAITKWQHEVIPLPKEIGDAPRMEKWYADYNERVKADYQARVELRKKLTERASPYAGAKVCKDCHAQEYAVWEASKHAHAFEALETVNKAFDPECLACHTVGFENDGFVDSAMTKHLQHVQCENCHGAAKAHVASNGKARTQHHGWSRTQVCAQCHNQKRSPDFDLEKRWPQVAHGKLREPLKIQSNQ